MSELEPPTKVLMIVWNGIEGDSRVQKSAYTLAQAGANVTLVGVSLAGTRRQGNLGNARVFVVPASQGSVSRALEATQVHGNSGEGPLVRIVRGARRLTWVTGLAAPSMLARFAQQASQQIAKEVNLSEFDVLHVHDYTAFEWATNVMSHMRSDVKVVYDAHEYLRGVGLGRRMSRYFLKREHALVQRANLVLTVSPPIADQLAIDYGLSPKPTVIRNTPDDSGSREQVTDIRARIGLSPETPLVAYSGGITEKRGIATLLAAAAGMPDVHLAVVAPSSRALDPYLGRPQCAVPQERLHVLEFVPPSDVPALLSTADVCVHPLWTHEKGHRLLNHAWALPNKWFEYIQARTPVVVSDVDYLAGLVKSLGIGEVFPATNVPGLQAALRRVLNHSERYRSNITDDLVADSQWSVDAEQLVRAYRQALGARLEVHVPEPSSLMWAVT